jgi:hypothetical protein
VAVPLSGIVNVGLVDELLLMVSWPVIDPAEVGSNVNVMLVACPGFRVKGKPIWDTENPLPLTAMEFTVTAAEPLEVSVTLCVVGVLTTTLPNGMLVAFTLSTGEAALSCRATERAVLPVVAVSVTDCALVTEATLAVNAALVAVAGTVTEAGTVTALLLLAMDTLTPPVGAEPVKLTVQASASDPVIEVLLHETALTVGATEAPVPLRLTTAVGAVLKIVNCPVAEVAEVGLN